jgi:hypothetical protein
MKWVKQNIFVDSEKFDRFTNYLDIKLNGGLKRLLDDDKI